MKKFICGVSITVLIAVVMLLAMPREAGAFAGGEGSLENPYQIETAEQLATVAETVYLDKHFILAADVDLSDTVWGATYAQAYSTEGWEPIGTSDDPFTGTFDGDGHTITGLYINRQDNHFVGLFGYTDGAAIQNVGLLDADVSGGTCVGGLVGFNSYTAITGSYAAGHVAGSEEDAGGLVGTNYGTITNSYATSSVEGGTHVGGLAGYNEGAIAGSHATGDVTGSGENVGGLVGSNEGTIENSYATGAVDGGENVGGLVGTNGLAGTDYGTVINSYATGNVTGILYVGGLAGNNEGTIEDSYATGAVNGGDYVGGLAGFNYKGAITNSHVTGSVNGLDTIGGLAGQNQGTVTGCYSIADVTGTDNVGGLAGLNFQGDIENSYAAGTVNGGTYIGGLVGFNYSSGSITNSYAAGVVEGNSLVCGLGMNDDGTINSSFWDTQTSGQIGTSGGTGKTTTEMKQQTTFTGDGWDFNNIWEINVGTYPYLSWQTDHYDFAPPVFADGYPQAENVTHSALDLLVRVDEDATAYYVVLSGEATAPTAAQIRAGTDADDEVLDANRKGSIGLSTDTEETVSITELEPETAYDIYVTAEDAAGNLQPDLLTAMKAVTTAEVPDTTVNIAAIPGITPPATGGTPVTTITETEQYTGTISWEPGHDPFQEETGYTATITLTAKTGFTFEGVSADFFTVSGATSVTNDTSSQIVTAVFPATESATYSVTFTVKDSDGATITGAEITINSTTLLTNASGVATINLENGTYPYGVTKTGFHAIIDGNVTVAGSPVAEAVEMTAESVEPDYITITDTSPADGAAGVSRTPAITVTFSDNIQADSSYGAITLKDAGSNTVSSSKNISGQVLTITPEGNLTYGTTYTVTVPADAVKSADAEANLAGQYQFSFTTRPAPTGGGGGGGSVAPKPATEISKEISAAGGGAVSLGDVSVHIPAGALPGDATFSIRKLTPSEVDEIVPEGMRLKLVSDVYDIITNGDRDFGDNTITIKIPYDQAKITAGDAPVINYYDGETGEWTPLQTTIEQGADGKWYAVVQVNHLTKFAVFSTAVPEPAPPQKVIKLTIGSTQATVDGQPYILDAAPFVDARADRTLVPIRFVSEALGAEVEWLAETRQVTITDNGKEIILTIDSTNVLVNGQKVSIDSAPATLPPGRTFVPLRFIGETLGAQVDYVNNTKQISIIR